MTLPVTWYHYPVALMPIGAALAIGRRPARKWIAAAIVLADVAIAFLPLLWVAVGVVLAVAAGSDDAAPAADPAGAADRELSAPRGLIRMCGRSITTRRRGARGRSPPLPRR